MRIFRPLAYLGCMVAALATQLVAQKMPREDVVEFPAVGEGLCMHNLFQSNMVIQRDKPVGIWGWADPGEQVIVTLAGKSETASAGKDRAWKCTSPAMPASSEPINITVKGKSKTLTLENIVVGDVWYLTGSTQLSGEWGYNQRDKDATIPETMPLVREFRRKTKASTFPTPRKRKFETGGGKYRSSWMTAEFASDTRGWVFVAWRRSVSSAQQVSRTRCQGFERS